MIDEGLLAESLHTGAALGAALIFASRMAASKNG